MGIFDWLFEKKRNKEAMEFFYQKMKQLDSLPEKKGKRSESGYPVCPHCDDELSLIETMERQQIDGLPVFQCPRCQKTFKL